MRSFDINTKLVASTAESLCTSPSLSTHASSAEYVVSGTKQHTLDDEPKGKTRLALKKQLETGRGQRRRRQAIR